MSPFNLRELSLVLALLANSAALNVMAGNDCTVWSSGSGSWTNRAQWSDNLPNPYQRTEIHGLSNLIIPAGTYVAGDREQ